MGKYKEITKQLKEQTFELTDPLNYDAYNCNYCPTTHHDLCSHQDKCIMNKEVAEILIQIAKIEHHINWIKSGEITETLQDKLNRLVIQRRKLYREYYSINTKMGGY